VTVIDEDGAATALEALTTPTTTTHDDDDDCRQQYDRQRYADAESADQRQLQQGRRRIQRQRRRSDRHRRSRRTRRIAAVVPRVASDAVAQVPAVGQRNARGTVQARLRQTSAERRAAVRRDDVGTDRTKEARRAVAHEVGDEVVARAAVQTRRTGAVVNGRLTQNALVTDVALTPEVVQSVDAAATVETWITATVVDISFTDHAFVASRTDTMEPIHSVHALTTCYHTIQINVSGVAKFTNLQQLSTLQS